MCSSFNCERSTSISTSSPRAGKPGLALSPEDTAKEERKGDLRLAIAILVTALIATPAATATPQPTKPLVAKTKKAKSRANFCPDHRRALSHYRIEHSKWLALRGVGKKLKVEQLRQPNGCAYTLYLAKRWKQKAAKAERAYKRWVAHFVIADIRHTPGSNAWLRSVNEAQKVYPGTKSWLLSCSDDEGGWGRWVPNTQGSGAGGWLQFMESTFWRMFYAAKDDAEARGFIVPDSAASWYSPIGQALAGGWGVTHGRRGEWSGAGC